MTLKAATDEKPAHILVEDDEDAIRELVICMLTATGYECRVAESPTQTLEILKSSEKFDLVLSGITEWAEEDFNRMIGTTSAVCTPVVVSTATYDISLMNKAIGMGAYDFLLRPFERSQLIFAVRRALEYRRLKLENLYFRDKFGLGSGINIPLSLLLGPQRDR